MIRASEPSSSSLLTRFLPEYRTDALSAFQTVELSPCFQTICCSGKAGIATKNGNGSHATIKGGGVEIRKRTDLARPGSTTGRCASRRAPGNGQCGGYVCDSAGLDAHAVTECAAACHASVAVESSPGAVCEGEPCRHRFTPPHSMHGTGPTRQQLISRQPGRWHVVQGQVTEISLRVWSRTDFTRDRRKPVRKPCARPTFRLPHSRPVRVSVERRGPCAGSRAVQPA